MRKKHLAGPARKYRRSPARYDAVRHLSVHGGRGIAMVTKMGCRDAVKGRKNPYKPEARGLISAYREGARICSAIDEGRDRALTAEERRVARKLDLEIETRLAQRRK